VQEVFGFVKRNLSGAKRRQDAVSGERGAGKGAQPLSPPQHAEVPKRGERFGLKLKIISASRYQNSPTWEAQRKRYIVAGADDHASLRLEVLVLIRGPANENENDGQERRDGQDKIVQED
jgi:hypothetical protein